MANAVAKAKKRELVPENLTEEEDTIQVSRKELTARLENDDMKFRSCYEQCVQYAASSRSHQEEADLYRQKLEEAKLKFTQLKNERDQFKNELEVHKSKRVRTTMELGKKGHEKSDKTFTSDVDEVYRRTEKENKDRIRKDLDKYSFDF